jgi:predicted nucleic acid-binding protein
MSDCVVDSSVVVKLVVDEPDSAKAAQMAADVAAGGGTPFILDFAMTEAANAIRTCHLRGLITSSEAAVKFAALQQVPAKILPAHPLLPAVFDLALQYRIAVYDALFVAAVDSLNYDGVTADEPLVRALGIDFPTIKLLRNW